MAKKSKKALGAAMAGVMAVGAVAGAANTVVTQVKADVASDVKAAHAKLEHLRTSLHNNYLGLKNQATWEIYAKEAQALINKLPNGSTKTTYQERLDRANAMILAAASVNHAEFSIQKNFPKADNANQWKAYAEKAMANVEKVEKGQEYSDRTPILVNRIVKVNAFADVVLKLEDARQAKDAKAMEALKEEAADLMTYFRDEMNYKDLMAYDLVNVIDQRIEEAGGLVEDKEAPVLNVDGATEITVENGAEVKLPVVTATDNVDKEVKVKSVVKDANGNELKSIDTKVAGVYTVTYSAEDAAGNKAKDVVVTVTVKEAKLAVESVNADNLKQFVIKFNKVIDKSSAEDKANYKFDKSTLNSGDIVKLNADGKSVTVTLANDVAQQAVKEVSVKDIKDANGLKLEEYKQDVTFLDLTIPTVVNAKQIAPNEVQVFFSEPVKGTGFLIDGGKYSANVKSYDDSTNSVILTTGTLAEGEHTVTVNSNTSGAVADYANLKVAKTDVNFVVSLDNTAPTLVSAEAKSQTKAVITFSEPIDVDTLGTNVYHTAEATAYKANSVTPVAGSNNTQFEVIFNNAIPAGTATFIVPKEKAKDNFGNKNESTLQVTAQVAVDTVKPTVEEFKYVDANKVEITLSEEVTGADVKGNFKVTDKDGKVVAFTVSGYTDKDRKVTLNFNPALKEGAEYKVEITGLKDKAVVPNEMDKYTNTFTATDVTGPVIQKTGVYNKTDRKITVFFNESVDGTTALDKSKYTLRYSDSKELALPSDATIALGGNNTSVTITLPTTVKNNDGIDISGLINGIVVGQVQDLAGNKSKTFTEVTFGAPDELNASNIVADSAKTIDERTVQFEVDTPLKSVVADDFTVNSNNVDFATFENKTLSNGKYGALVTLKVAESNKWATDATPVVATKNQEISSESLYGSKFEKNVTNLVKTKDGVAPAVDKTGNNYNVVVKDNYTDNAQTSGQDGIVDTIEVTFTENIKGSTVSIDDFEVVGYEVSDLSTSGSKVTIRIKQANAANITDTFVIKLVGDISDANDNILKLDASKEYKSKPVQIPDAPISSAVSITKGTTANKVGVNVATTLEYRVTDSTGKTEKQGWTTGTGSATDTTADVVEGDIVEVRVKATATSPASDVYKHTVASGEIGE